MKEINKIFCIGLNKTGTTSLHIAFQKLGFKSVHWKDKQGNNIKDIILDNYEKGNKLLDGLDQYDAYSDWNLPTTNFLFKKLDEQYPDSLFIFTTRNREDWILSREKHVKRTPNWKELQKLKPDNPWWNMDKKAWQQEYDDLHNSVYEYFKDRPNDLLIFDLTKGDEWSKLCSFLTCNVPDIPFPDVKKASDFTLRNKLKSELNRIIKKLNLKT